MAREQHRLGAQVGVSDVDSSGALTDEAWREDLGDARATGAASSCEASVWRS